MDLPNSEKKEIQMKKWLIGLFTLVFIVVVAGTLALYYIRPERDLTLAYAPVPLEERAVDMARRLSRELVLSSDDIENLAKRALADNPFVEKDVQVTGAEFSVSGDRLLADLNIIWKDRVSAAIQVTYRLRWEAPNVVAAAEKATIKGIALPTSMFSDQVIPIGDSLPAALKIEKMTWGSGGVKVLFRKPSLQDLQNLIGG